MVRSLRRSVTLVRLTGNVSGNAGVEETQEQVPSTILLSIFGSLF